MSIPTPSSQIADTPSKRGPRLFRGRHFVLEDDTPKIVSAKRASDGTKLTKDTMKAALQAGREDLVQKWQVDVEEALRAEGVKNDLEQKFHAMRDQLDKEATAIRQKLDQEAKTRKDQAAEHTVAIQSLQTSLDNMNTRLKKSLETSRQSAATTKAISTQIDGLHTKLDNLGKSLPFKALALGKQGYLGAHCPVPAGWAQDAYKFTIIALLAIYANT